MLTLQRQFDQIVFSHVFPSPETRKARPVQPPLSLVKVRGRSGWHDLALVGQPVLLHGLAPAFRMDWKDTEDVDKAFGWESPRREMRVRTAVNGQRRKAADEQLFAYEMVVPDGFLWHGRVDFSQIEDEQERTAAASQLKSLMELGLSALGKTKTGAKVVLDDEGAVPPFIGSSAEGRDSRWVVTLQTPALMSDPRELTGMDREQRLRAGYEAYWHDLLGGVFELEHFYARQKLAGGFYLWKRFSPMTPYSPYLLTEAGSVFVLRSTRPELAVPRIRDWLRHGLPLPRWAVERYAAEGRPGNHWQNCPYIPQNGYGEIAVNLAAHWNDGPKPEQMEVIHVL